MRGGGGAGLFLALLLPRAQQLQHGALRCGFPAVHALLPTLDPPAAPAVLQVQPALLRHAGTESAGSSQLPAAASAAWGGSVHPPLLRRRQLVACGQSSVSCIALPFPPCLPQCNLGTVSGGPRSGQQPCPKIDTDRAKKQQRAPAPAAAAGGFRWPWQQQA